MTSIVPGYEYNIFISYRQKDNKHDGWVTEFVDNLKGELENLRSKIGETYMDAGLTPPTIKELMEKFAGQRSLAESVINVMLKEGSLIKINEDLYFHKKVLTRLREDYNGKKSTLPVRSCPSFFVAELVRDLSAD